jgi:hypothetical protein
MVSNWNTFLYIVFFDAENPCSLAEPGASKRVKESPSAWFRGEVCNLLADYAILMSRKI